MYLFLHNIYKCKIYFHELMNIQSFTRWRTQSLLIPLSFKDVLTRCNLFGEYLQVMMSIVKLKNGNR